MSDYTTIELSKQGKHKGKYVTIVDSIDADLDQYRWCVWKKRYVYRHIYSDGIYTMEHLHRVILSRKLGRELIKGEIVDHIDGNGLNNTSGYKGVTYHKRDNVWQASIQVDGKPMYLGSYDTPENAFKVVCEARKKYHQEFANYGDKENE